MKVGKWENKEVDFVARDAEGVMYAQVAATVMDRSTLERELDPLLKIQDNFPKLLLTLDIMGAGTSHRGIRQLNVCDWLLAGQNKKGKERSVDNIY